MQMYERTYICMYLLSCSYISMRVCMYAGTLVSASYDGIVNKFILGQAAAQVAVKG